MSNLDNATTEHPNALLLRQFFEAFGAADLPRLNSLATTDFVYHFPGTSAYAGDFHGMEELLSGVRAVAMTLGQGRNGFELLQVFANDECAITVHRDYYTGDDNHLDLRYFLYVRIESGLMAEVWEVPFDADENHRYVSVQSANLAKQIAGQPHD